MAKKKSAFVMAGEQAQDIVREASKTTRSNLLDAGQIIEGLNLSKGQTVSLICKVSGIKTAVHTEDPSDPKYDKDKAGLPYVNFQFVPTSGPLKGGSIGNFMPCYDREDLEISQQALEWVFREFQGLDYETEGWTLADIEHHANEINEVDEKPVVSLSISCREIKKGKRRGELAINCRIGRLIEDGSDDDDDDDEDDKPVETVVTPPPAKTGKTRTAAKAAPSEEDDEPYVPKVGDKVTYVYNEDGEEEELTCTVTKINARKKTCSLSDGEYDYDDIKFDEVTLV